MTHTLTISGLDDEEATHISEILHLYKSNMIFKKIEVMAEGNRSGDVETAKRMIDWFDSHIAWHEEIMSKIKWTKE